MSSKRQAEEQSGRDRKKQKLKDARTIPVQSNALAGPSTVPSVGKRLPGALDVEKFTEARAFEINAMHTAMKNASDSATHRVWQTLPRHLRRRAASHDVRRMPIRLRDKARLEMKDTALKKKPLARLRSKHGKAKRLGPTESLLKRQKDKTWLETHIWHSKRMHMENMWGHRLAVTPTEKAFRPSHRAAVHGSIIHDASYYSTFQLHGPQKLLSDILSLFSDPLDPSPGAKRYHPGLRTAETHIYEIDHYPFNLIGPASIIWRPQQAPETAQPAKSSKKGKGKATDEQDLDNITRTVWVRVHPSISGAVFAAMQQSTSLVLDRGRAAAPQGTVLDHLSVELEDLSAQINAFEIMGPKASQVLKGALTPVSQDKRDDFKKLWESMSDLQTSGSLPRSMIIGFKVLDPRLKFPPKNAKPNLTNDIPKIVPCGSLAQTELWDSSVRENLKKPRYKKKDLDDRRAQNLVPGTPLNPLRQDDRIPVMLIQRAVERGSSSTLSLHGWTLLIPAGWSMPFFSSLTFTGTRVGGQRERRTQAFEAGTGYFPHDYPLCSTYEEVAKQRETEDRARWERTPPAKRHNYESTGTRSPWRADWEVVLGLQKPTDIGLVSTQREPAEAEAAKPWLLRGRHVEAIVEKMMHPGVEPSLILYNELHGMCAKRGMGPISATPDALLQGALVRVEITPRRRGNPHELAVIYSVHDEEVQHLTSDREDDEDESKPEAAIPPHTDIIGYVTSGNFSLTQGTGFALGAISLKSLLCLKEQSLRLQSQEILVKIRDRDGQVCRAAHLKLLEALA
ncbi:POP1-domain-containing protein [Mycena amicta]|nr:POP1-domain-containing protein [Mycena amicta]